MIEYKNIAAPGNDIICGIFLFQQFNYLLAAKAEYFRADRLCGIPDQKRDSEINYKTYYKRPGIRQFFLRLFSTRSSRRRSPRG